MPGSKFEEDQWEILIDRIEEDNVIPIIGAELVQVSARGCLVSLEEWLASQLRAHLNLGEVPPEAQGMTPLLQAVICDHLQQGGNMEGLYKIAKNLIESEYFPVPPALAQLAEISDFNLYVSTTFDGLMMRALEAGRPGAKIQELSFTTKRFDDLPVPLHRLDHPVVYHLFGRLGSTPRSYALGDEDRLEWITTMQQNDDELRMLFAGLSERHLLVLGVGYRDWLARFFLRTAKQRRLSDSRDLGEIFADLVLQRDESLVLFLETISSNTVLFADDGGAVSFVEELHRRWKARQGSRPERMVRRAPPLPRSNVPGFAATPDPGRFLPPGGKMIEGSIFISYSRGDLPAVKKFAAALNAAGIATWFDMSLQAGDDFVRDVQYNIQTCSYFVAVLSRETVRRKEGFFRREWHWANERTQSIAPGQPFVLPVLIDGSDIKDSRPPESFMRANAVRALDGTPEPTLIALFAELVPSTKATHAEA